jgi:hypothetical protein
MKCLAPRSALLAVLVLATSLQLCVSTLEAIKGLHRGGPAVAVCPDKATDDGREQHRPVAEVEKELAMVRKRAAGDPSLDGDHTFDDGYPTALIHYSGGNSTDCCQKLSLSMWFPIHYQLDSVAQMATQQLSSTILVETAP